MNGNKREQLERLLGDQDIPEPPAGLVEKIKNEIPAQIPAAAPANQTARPWWTWRVAASLIVLLGVGYLGYQSGFRGGLEESSKDQSASPTVFSTRSAPKASSAANQLPAATQTTPLDDRSQTEAIAVQARSNESSANERDSRDFISEEEKREIFAQEPQAIRVTMEAPAVAPPAAQSSADSLKMAAKSGRRDETAGVEGGVVGGMVESLPEPPPPGAPLSPPAESATNAARSRMMRATSPRVPPSTGGTDEPNDQPYADTFFRNYGTNPFVDTEDDPVSTFGLDVDTASYTVARRYLTEGRIPPADAIRPEEFLNYFEYDDQAPARGDFAIYSEGAASPFPVGPRYAMIRFGIRARSVSSGERAPSILTFVVDTSGSMAQQNRLELVKEALNLLIGQLREDDEIGLVTFSTQAQLVLEPTSDHQAIRRAIETLRPSGSTNAADGLQVGYDTAVAAFRRGASNRVILLSDGVANVGATSAEAILDQVAEMRNRGVMLNTVGVGMGNFNDVLLEQLANKANGSYAYVDDVEEARRVFVENLTGTLQTVAEDARVQVLFNSRLVARYRLIGYENRAIADERFRDDDVDAGEIGSDHSVTALYEVKLHEEPRGRDELAVLTLRYRPADQRKFRELTRTIRLSELSNWESASPRFQLATLVAAFAERLKQSYWARHIDPGELAARTGAVAARMRRDEKVTELTGMTRQAADLLPPVEKPE